MHQLCWSGLKNHSSLGQLLHAQVTLREISGVQLWSRQGKRSVEASLWGCTHSLAPHVVENFCAACGECVEDELADNQTQDGITCMAADQIRSSHILPSHIRMIRR